MCLCKGGHVGVLVCVCVCVRTCVRAHIKSLYTCECVGYMRA